MRRRLLWWGGLLFGLALTVWFILKLYTVEIVHFVVTETLIQKAPPDYPVDTVRLELNRRLAECRRQGGCDDHLARLKRLSHLLEKAPRLSAEEIEEILENFGG